MAAANDQMNISPKTGFNSPVQIVIRLKKIMLVSYYRG
jgi:hypothetical protein